MDPGFEVDGDPNEKCTWDCICGVPLSTEEKDELDDGVPGVGSYDSSLAMPRNAADGL